MVNVQRFYFFIEFHVIQQKNQGVKIPLEEDYDIFLNL